MIHGSLHVNVDLRVEHCKRRPECPHVKGSPSEPYAFTSICSTYPSFLPTSPNVSKSMANNELGYLPKTPKTSKDKHNILGTSKEQAVTISKKRGTSKVTVRRSHILAQNSQSTPIPTSKLRKIIQKARNSGQFEEKNEPSKKIKSHTSPVDARQSGPIIKPYCTFKEFEKISSMTVGAYVDWIGEEIINAFDRITNNNGFPL